MVTWQEIQLLSFTPDFEKVWYFFHFLVQFMCLDLVTYEREFLCLRKRNRAEQGSSVTCISFATHLMIGPSFQGICWGSLTAGATVAGQPPLGPSHLCPTGKWRMAPDGQLSLRPVSNLLAAGVSWETQNSRNIPLVSQHQLLFRKLETIYSWASSLSNLFRTPKNISKLQTEFKSHWNNAAGM